MQISVRLIAAGFTLAFLAGAGGCAGTVASRASIQPAGVARSESLFLAPDVDAASGGYGDEYARRDAQMSFAPTQVATATEQWPTDPQPSLEYPRRVFLDSRSFGDSITFFSTQPDYRYYYRDQRHHWR